MSPSGDSPPQYNLPPNALLYQRQRSRIQEIQSLQLRAQSQPHHDLARRDPYGDKLARIYPRELRKSPGAANRYVAPSSPHPVTSPLLSALSTTTNTAAQYTSDWTKSLPFFANPPAGSAANSPPNQIPIRSGRDAVSNSPPAFQPRSNPNNPSFGIPQLPQRDRRASMYSQNGNAFAHRGYAPQPHEDQAHFYGNIDFDSIGLPDHQQLAGLTPGENGYFCGWDSFSNAGNGPSASAENVLLVGWEGGLRVYRVSRKSIDVIGSLEGLKGAVIGAKILPWTSRKDPGSAGRPYVALTIHGPVLEDSVENHNSSDESAPVSTDESSPEPSVRPSSRQSSTRPLNDVQFFKQYQTTVEVFSLSTRKHVATLFSSPIVTNNCDPMDLNNYKKTPPIGDLKVEANGKFVVVASGQSGEIFVYSPWTKRQGHKDLETIRCVGKLWTIVQPREAKKQPPSPNGYLNGSNSGDDDESAHGIPLFSLANRWIATVPPTRPVFSLNGKAHLGDLPPTTKPPGLATHVAPTPPPRTTCAVDIPEGSDLMSRMSRELTQNALKSAEWLRGQGTQAWNTYFNRPVPVNGTGYPQPPAAQSHFPPTHDYSNAAPAANTDPTQVAVYDLERLLNYVENVPTRNALVPLATFELPSGCSFLSFAPSGLHMVTVSKKGDEQFVWSLMKMRDPRSAIPGAPKSESGPYVRQIKKFSRMTTAVTVDIAWSSPYGERFSILTDRGTIHSHEIPASVFQWPPLRRARRMKKGQIVQHERPASPQGRFSSAVNVLKKSGTWLNTARTQGLNGTLGGLANVPANVNARTIKAGFRTSLGAMAVGAQAVIHAADNKLHLGPIVSEATPGCMRWMTGRDKRCLAIVAAGSVFIYAVKQTTTSRRGQPPLLTSKIKKRPIQFSIHAIPDDFFAPALRDAVQARQNGTTPESTAVTGTWQLRAPTASANKRTNRRKENWHYLIEAETNPPYQPFHTDRRVSLFAFTDSTQPSNMETSTLSPDSSQYGLSHTGIPSSHIKSLHTDTQWLFGEPLLNLRCIREGGGGGSGLDDDLDDSSLGEGNGTDGLNRHIEVEDGEVVVTTVRRKGREEEEFFEDDCEVLDFAEDRV